MEKLAVSAEELCQLINGGMRDRGSDPQNVAIQITARDDSSEGANWTAHLANSEGVSWRDTMAFVYAYAEVQYGYDLLSD
jgi:hypothetical protein